MTSKKSVRVFVAGMFFVCALVATTSMTAQADTVVTTIPVGSNPQSLAINPAGTFAYVTNTGDDTVSKINLATDTVVATTTVGLFPIRVAINPAGTYAYVTNQYSSTVSKIDLSTDTVVATITVGNSPIGVAINPAGTFAYVAAGEVISIINLATDTVSHSIIKPSTGSYGVAINSAGTFAYVTNHSQGTVSKINLTTNAVASSITVGLEPIGVVINPAGTFAYVTNGSASTVSKIALTSANDSQAITFAAVSTQLLGANSVALSATASSNLTVSLTSTTPSVCTESNSTVTMLTTGVCTITANQSGGSGWDAAPEVSRTFTILPSPLAGEIGVSIKNGDSFSNTKQVTLNLIWPEYATAVRISNDGGFAASKTQTKELAASIDWELDDSVKGIFTKLVYVRFNGVADTTKTYSDDIILDTTAPVLESASATALSGSIAVSVKATDDITGVDKIQITNGTTTVTEDYAAEVSVPLADISLTVLSMGVQKLAATSVKIRVSDYSGNWSAYKALPVPGVSTAMTVRRSKPATSKSIAIFAKIPVLSTSKVSIKVVSGYAKLCKVSGTKLKGIKAGTCKVTVTVTPKKGKATSRTVTLAVTN